MTFKQIQDLIKLVNKSELGEVKIEQDNFKISIKTKDYFQKKAGAAASPIIQTAPPVPAPAPTPGTEAPAQSHASAEPKQTQSSAEKSEDATEEDSGAENYITVKSPMIGTFYRNPSPDKPPFIKVGDTISKGQVTCIIEAMKLFNEIESEVEGKVVKILVDDASPVEYDQPLFLVDPA